MKDLVSHRSMRTVGSISALLLLWVLFVSPGGVWAGFVSVGALCVLLVVAAVVWMGRAAPAASLAQVIHEVGAEPAVAPSSNGNRRALR